MFDLETFRQTSINPKYRPNVLIVEDEPYWQHLLAGSVLSIKEKANLTCVPDVATARRILKHKRDIDLILADYILEGSETGLDLWRDPPKGTPRQKIILVTGKPLSEIMQIVGSNEIIPNAISKNAPIESIKAALETALQVNLFPKTKRFSRLLAAALFLSLLGLSWFTELHQLRPQRIIPMAANEHKSPSPQSVNFRDFEKQKSKIIQKKDFKIDDIITTELKTKVDAIGHRGDEIIKLAQIGPNDELRELHTSR